MLVENILTIALFFDAKCDLLSRDFKNIYADPERRLLFYDPKTKCLCLGHLYFTNTKNFWYLKVFAINDELLNC